MSKRTSKNKYDIGDKIDTKHGELEIISILKKNNKRYYKYKCLNCDNIDEIREDHLKNGTGCNACCKYGSLKVAIGINDMNTICPSIIKYLANDKDLYKYRGNSSIKIPLKCPNCGTIKMISPGEFTTCGFSCPRCGDGISIPNKIMFNILYQLNIDFEIEKKFNWCKYLFREKLRQGYYDFYIPSKSIIIEMDGGWHIKDNIRSKQTAEESKYIDDEKDRLAQEHEIKVIRINCRKSEIEYIKNNILNSELESVLNIKNIDWIICDTFSSSTRVKEVCELWNKNIYNTIDISGLTKLSVSTVRKYLNKGTKINLCKYNGKDILIQHNKEISFMGTKEIICLNNLQIYSSAREIQEKLGISYKSISNCCTGRSKSSGKDKNGDKLKWMFYNEYLNNI